MYLRDKNEILVFKWSEMVSLPVGDLIPLIGLKDKYADDRSAVLMSSLRSRS